MYSLSGPIHGLGALVWENGIPVPVDVAPPGEPPAPVDTGDPCDTGSYAYDQATCDQIQGATTGASKPTSQPWYTLPVEVFHDQFPVVIQPGGVPTIPAPIPASLPPGYGGESPASENTGLFIALAALAAIAFLPKEKKRRRA